MTTTAITTTSDRTVSTWLTPASFEAAEKIAGLMAKMGTMPAHLKDKPADCFRVVVQAAKWQMDPFAVGECTSLVHGRMCYEGKLVHAVLITMGAIKGTLDFQYDGPEDQDARSIVVSGVLANGETRTVKGTVRDWKTTGNGSPWRPGAFDRQLAYRGTREWARLWAPHAVLGVMTPDEASETQPIDVTHTATVHDDPKPGKTREVPKEAQDAGTPAATTSAAEQKPTKGTAAEKPPAEDHPEHQPTPLEKAKAMEPSAVTVDVIWKRCTVLSTLKEPKQAGHHLLQVIKEHNAAWKIITVSDLGGEKDEDRKRYLVELEEKVVKWSAEFAKGVVL